MLQTLFLYHQKTAMPLKIRLLFSFFFLMVSIFIPSLIFAQEEKSENPFANFETIMLPNGLKVWYKNLPNDSNISVSVNVPWGADQDPIGKEQLAHFTEHMLFSDQLGRTEAQIKKEIEDLGGVTNAFTFSDHTFYFVRIDKKHGLFAMDWLYKIISPHEMKDFVVEKQREPVAVEVGAKKREFFDWIEAYYLNSPWLRQPNFWTREFGEELFPKRNIYYYESLNKITTSDLKQFYDTYYTPKGMTLTVIGNLDRTEVLEKINQTFANLTSKPVYISNLKPSNPNRFSQFYTWTFRPTTSYSNIFKFYELTANDYITLTFISRFLQNRLNNQLRFGDRKATYSIGCGASQRGPVTVMQIFGELNKSEYQFAYETIENEIGMLHSSSHSSETFENEKKILIGKLKTNNSSAKDLEQWVTYNFYNPNKYQDFPNVVAEYEKISKEDVEKFVRNYFVKKHQVLEIDHVFPITQGILSFLGLGLILLTLSATRRILLSNLNLSSLRYIARFKMSPFTRLIGGLVILSLMAISGQLLLFFYNLITYNFILPIENFWVQWSVFALMAMFALFLFIFTLGHLPGKLLLFSNSLTIKYLSYRSKTISLEQVKEISLQTFSSVWLSRRIWKCIPLTLAIFSPGIYLKLNDGWSYFFQIRNNQEFLTLFDQLKNVEKNTPENLDGK